MPDTNQIINTTQPRPLKGLRLRGVKLTPEIMCVKKGAGKDGEDIFLKCREEDYEKELHGEKVDKLPARKKKAAKKKAKAADDE